MMATSYRAMCALHSSPRLSFPRPIAAPSAVPTTRRPLLYVLGGGIMGYFTVRNKSAAKATSYPSTASEVLEQPDWPEAWPFRPEQFERYDESPDSEFYSYPRFVTHIDDKAIAALTDFYAEAFPPSGSPDTALLDICSSWISHYPPNYKASKIVGLGMNEEELGRNPILTSFDVKDLNESPTLPYPDGSFDVVTNAVSVDYLTKPMEVFGEISRVLKPGGVAIMSFSNRCFPTKAISLWTATGDLDHVWLVGSYFHFAGGFDAPQARDITRTNILGQKGDPMYVVYSRKKANA